MADAGDPVIEAYGKEYFTGEGYKEPYYDYPHHDMRVGKILSMANPSSVLDVGCAYGYIVRRLLDLGIPAFGIDISTWCGEQAKKIIPGNFMLHDVRDRLPFNNKQFDVLYCEGVLEHIEDEFISDIMREFDRVSNKRILQVSFNYHEQTDESHVNLHDHNWWFTRIPKYTWLFLSPTGTQTGEQWLYKA